MTIIMDAHPCTIVEISIEWRQIQMFTALTTTVARKFLHSLSAQQKFINLSLQSQIFVNCCLAFLDKRRFQA